jgi:chromosome segregation ATPase
MPDTIPDQSEIVALNDQLKADLATAKQTIGTLQKQVDAEKASNATLTGEVSTLKKNLTDSQAATTKANSDLATITSERDTLKATNAELSAKEQDLEKRTAAKVAALGISGKAAAQPAAKADKKLSLDEQVALAKGTPAK